MAADIFAVKNAIYTRGVREGRLLISFRRFILLSISPMALCELASCRVLLLLRASRRNCGNHFTDYYACSHLRDHISLQSRRNNADDSDNVNDMIIMIIVTTQMETRAHG